MRRHLRLVPIALCWGVLTLTATAQITGRPGSYRDHLLVGVAAYKAGRLEDAARSFERAGRTAPDASLWRMYLALAAGDDVMDVEPPLGGASWEFVPEQQSTNNPRLNAIGTRILAGRKHAALLDAETGEHITTLRHSTGRGLAWVFDTSGRVVVGIGRGKDFPFEAGPIDIRDARTGRPLVVDGEIDRLGSYDAIYRWEPRTHRPGTAQRQNSDDVRTGKDGVMRGVLHCRLSPPSRDHSDFLAPTEGIVIRTSRGVPRWTSGVDTRTGFELWRRLKVSFSITDGDWAAEGGLLLVGGQDRVECLRAATGKVVRSWQFGGDVERSATKFAVDGRTIVRLSEGTALTVIQPDSKAPDVEVQLDPPVASMIRRIHMVQGGETLLVQARSYVMAYDVATGAQLWRDQARSSIDQRSVLASKGMLALEELSGGAVRVLDLRTGKARFPTGALPVSVEGVQLLPGTDWVALSDSGGAVRIVDLDGGATLAVDRTHAGQDAVQLEVGQGAEGEPRVITWTKGSPVVLRDAALRTIGAVELRKGERVLAANAGAGLAVLAGGSDGKVTLADLEAWSRTPLRMPWSGRGFAAMDDGGERVAVTSDGALFVVDTKDASQLKRLEVDGVARARAIALDGAGHAVVTLGDPPKPIAVDLETGDVLGQLGPRAWLPFGGFAPFADVFDDIGVAAYTVSSAGVVEAFHTRDWSHAWTLNLNGGNPGVLIVRHDPGGERGFVSGMVSTHATVVDMRTGKLVADTAKIGGLFHLGGTADGQYVFGTRDGSLIVFDGHQWTQNYRRSESSKGAAWIHDGSTRRAAAGVEERLDDSSSTQPHLWRDGWSQPVDCWDALLLDPLELGEVSIDLLPTPPIVVEGSVAPAAPAEGSVLLKLTVDTEDELLGLLIEIEGRPATFAPADPDFAGEPRVVLSATVPGPFPCSASLRAVTRGGIQSAPWFVNVGGE